MGMKWPENPGPDEWYVEAIPDKSDERGRFCGVWLVIRSMAFPAHRADFRFIKLGAANFDWQWDFAINEAKNLISRLNFVQYNPAEKPNPASADRVCAECGEPACPNDYLCNTCRRCAVD